jgi:hydrogenase maturation protease
MNLAEELRSRLMGRVAVVGVGNPDLGDDGAGLRLAERLAAHGVPDVTLAGRSPERWLGRLGRARVDRVLFLDAVDAGTAPGAILLMDAAQTVARFPQVSTHTLSLGTLARLLEADGIPGVSLLGIQPASLRSGAGLSAPVETTVGILADLLRNLLLGGPQASPAWGEQP